jgi:guanine deaminase
MENEKDFVLQVISMAEENVRKNHGGPFGAIIVKDGQIIGRGVNTVIQTNDPTAHAEITAIRDACMNTGHFKLENAVIYSSCEPCPMCLGAIYWAGIARIVFASSNTDAAEAGFNDSFIYKEVPMPFHKRSIPTVKVDVPTHLQPFKAWAEMENKTLY